MRSFESVKSTWLRSELGTWINLEKYSQLLVIDKRIVAVYAENEQLIQGPCISWHDSTEEAQKALDKLMEDMSDIY